MKLRNTILLIGSMFICTALIAQEQTENKHYKHGIGAVAGFTTGYGLSYRFTPNRFGVQANFFSTFSDNNYNAGITFMYTLVKIPDASFYVYQSNEYNYSKYYDQGYPFIGGEYKYDEYFDNGLGLGFEVVIIKRIGINVMGGYGAFENFNRINFTVETGVFFKL